MIVPDTRSTRGQAAIESVAAVAIFILIGALSLQILATGHTASLADGAAEAAAVAVVNGRSAERAARRSLPGWAAERAAVVRIGGAVRVGIDSPSVIGPLARLLRVTSSARVDPGRTP